MKQIKSKLSEFDRAIFDRILTTAKRKKFSLVNNDYGERDPVTATEAGLIGVSSARSGFLSRYGYL